MPKAAAPLLAAALLALAGVPAHAQDYDRPGPYLGGAGSFALYSQIERDLGDIFNVDVDNVLGANVRAGYRLHPNVAAELQAEWLQDAEVTISGVPSRSLETVTATVNVKALMVAREFHPYLLGGLGVQHSDIVNEPPGAPSPIATGGATRFALRLGAGLDYYLTGNWLLNFGGSYIFPTSNYKGVSLDYVSFDWGFQYRF